MHIDFHNKKQFVFDKSVLSLLKKILKKVKQEFKLPNYCVELHIVDDAKIKKINKEYRNIDKVTDVLSFSLLDDQIKLPYLGIIFICFSEISKFSELGFQHNFAFLFLHGVLHLLGMDHGEEMSSKQELIMKECFWNKT